MIQTGTAPIGSREIPGPRGGALLRLLPHLATRPLEVLKQLNAEYGDIVSLQFPFESVVFLFHPDYVEHVLHHRHQVYDKQTPRWQTLRQIWGDGLLTSDRDVWRRQRQRMQPAFHQGALRGFGDVIADEAQRMGRMWSASASSGEPRDVYVDMLHTAVRALTRATFGSAIEGKTDTIIAAINDINAYINPISLSNLLRLPNSVRRWVTPGFVPYQRAMRTVQQIFGAIIQQRLASGEQLADLLGLMMCGKDDEVAATMTEAQLHDEMMTILMAGHETTGIATAWSWYWISQNPEVERRLQEEVDTVLGGRPPGFDDLPKLEYARRVFQEAMRLTPPIWAYDRCAREDDSIDGYRIPRGTFVGMSPYVMHRHPKYWERPEEFDPDRFAPSEMAKRPQYAYFPFGGGPRRCIGFKFALMEGQLILATLAQAFTARLMAGQVVVPAPRLNLPPKLGLRMIVQPRQPHAFRESPLQN